MRIAVYPFCRLDVILYFCKNADRYLIKGVCLKQRNMLRIASLPRDSDGRGIADGRRLRIAMQHDRF